MELNEGWEDVIDEDSTTTSLVNTDTDPDVISLVDDTFVSAQAVVDAALYAQDSELEAQESQVWALESKLWAKRAERAAEQVAGEIAQHTTAAEAKSALLLQLVEMKRQNQALASQLSALQRCSDDFMDVIATGVKCKECRKEFQGSGFRSALSRFHQHFRDTHQIPNSPDTHECPNCLKVFRDKGIAKGAERLFQHRQSCDTLEMQKLMQHECPKCFSSFGDQGNHTGMERLSQHRRTCRAL